jgi:hypothetical protein
MIAADGEPEGAGTQNVERGLLFSTSTDIILQGL